MTADSPPAAVEKPPWLVPLSAPSSRTPLFLVHAVSGSVSPYLALARLLDRQCYGLEARGLHGEEADAAMEAAAVAYAGAVRTVSDGPYLLGGWSLGGAIAFEMARVLKGGGDVPLVLLLDTDPDWIRTAPPTDEELLARYIDDVARMHPGSDLALRLGEAAGGSRRDKVAAVAALLVASGLAPAAVEADVRVRIEVSLLLAHGFSSYSPRPLDVRAALLSTSDGAAAQRAVWRELATGGLVDGRVPGDHYTLLRNPHVETVAEAVTSALAGVEH